jgi:hypothetical protein
LATVLLIGIHLPVRTAHSQDQRPPVNWTGVYNAPRNFAHMLECTAIPLVQDLSLDESQQFAVREVVRVYKDTTTRVRNSMQANRRQAVRDSAILRILRSRSDSATYRRNVARERSWWLAGKCNGLPQLRSPER